jgi:hypothetical protein
MFWGGGTLKPLAINLQGAFTNGAQAAREQADLFQNRPIHASQPGESKTDPAPDNTHFGFWDFSTNIKQATVRDSFSRNISVA